MSDTIPKGFSTPLLASILQVYKNMKPTNKIHSYEIRHN